MLSTSLRRHSTRVFLGFVAAGFAFLVAELIFLDHYKGTQLIALIAAVGGILASLIAFVPRIGIRRVALGLFIILAISGVYGFIEHKEERGERGEETSAAIAAASDRVSREALESFASNPPVLSPLALSGMAVLGIVTLMVAEGDPEHNR